jgi:hypothetical protein
MMMARRYRTTGSMLLAQMRCPVAVSDRVSFANYRTDGLCVIITFTPLGRRLAVIEIIADFIAGEDFRSNQLGPDISLLIAQKEGATLTPLPFPSPELCGWHRHRQP